MEALTVRQSIHLIEENYDELYILPGLILSIKRKLKGKLPFVFDQPYPDENGNKLVSIDFHRVYVNERNRSFLLEYLTLWDAIYILELLEKQ